MTSSKTPPFVLKSMNTDATARVKPNFIFLLVNQIMSSSSINFILKIVKISHCRTMEWISIHANPLSCGLS